MSKFKDAYLSEAEDHLQKLDDSLLLLEKHPKDKAILNDLMRSAHTLKGSSSSMGYSKTAFLTHVMEDVFDDARNGKISINKEIISILFKTVDTLSRTIISIKEEDKEIDDVEEEANTLKMATGVSTEVIGIPHSDYSEEHSATIPLISSVKKDATVETFDKRNVHIENTPIEYIKVPIARLDKLMSLLEELLIDKMKIVDLSKSLPDLETTANHLDRLVSDIQYQIMQTRMVPIGQVFMRFSRFVRDLAIQMEKDVDFQITGGEIELDRTIVDKLAEPLIHLLKNAVDHGIDKVGIVRLSATREKEFAIITVENVGRSIDWNKVRAVAVARNVVTSEDAQHLDKPSLINLLYLGSISTKDYVTETSGRGIGLSVVKNFIEQVGGRIDVSSPVSGTQGVIFRMELPLSMAIVSVLLFEVSGSVFALPFSSIEQTVKVDESMVKSIAGQDIVIIKGDSIPLVYLAEIFARTGAVSTLGCEQVDHIGKSILVIVLHRGEERVGLVVDRLRDELEIIIKPLPSILRKMKWFSGTAILGDGRTILVIDALSLLGESYRMASNKKI